MKQKSYIDFMMNMAYVVANNSLDPHKKVGAVIANKQDVIAYGWNGTPYGYPINDCKDDNEKTLPEVVHAEINAIAKAAATTHSTRDAAMFTTTIPCVECAKAIIQAGITAVVYKEEENKCQKGSDLLLKCGVLLIKQD